MDSLLFTVSMTSLLWGYLLYLCIIFLRSKETEYNPSMIRFLSLYNVQFICLVAGINIYLYQGMTAELLLYSGIASVLLIDTYTDIISESIYDLPNIIGILYVLLFQLYLGQVQFALLGATVAFLVTFVKFLVGNYLFTFSHDVELEIQNEKEKHIGCFRFAFVPSLTIATIINALLPDGLAFFLMDIAEYIRSNNQVLILVVSISILLLIWTMNSRKYLAGGVIDLSGLEENEYDTSAFGDGDIVTCVFLGTVLGWQDFLAVFWLGMVIQAIIACLLGIKYKGDLKWI